MEWGSAGSYANPLKELYPLLVLLPPSVSDLTLNRPKLTEGWALHESCRLARNVGFDERVNTVSSQTPALTREARSGSSPQPTARSENTNPESLYLRNATARPTEPDASDSPMNALYSNEALVDALCLERDLLRHSFALKPNCLFAPRSGLLLECEAQKHENQPLLASETARKRDFSKAHYRRGNSVIGLKKPDPHPIRGSDFKNVVFNQAGS
ncbi:unnamed protein product [Pleuronectes platessa]|uniref:Uncharacterized protein n=1 Tax=Pleuronectes platessa TaxID=8262 RepID=A0A9N7UJ50_PLEPL|nr:unnamed protein product [Pleuronectes platessa]